MDIRISERIKDVIPNCRLGYSVIDDVTIKGTIPALKQEFMALQAEVAKLYKLEILPTIPRIASVRSMYKKLAFDPSRYRPASEALVRRVLQGKNLYYVNSAVDVNNYCSIKYLLPFGLYDAEQIAGDVEYRVAEQGTYVNIGGKVISTEHKPFLVDELGVFGNPTSDARRTAVTLSTHQLLSVIYADEEVTEAMLGEILEFTTEMFIRHNGGDLIVKKIIRT